MKLSGPKILLHVEGLVVLVAACIVFHAIGAAWVTFAVLFLAPDLAMLGYFFGKAIGARNAFAHGRWNDLKAATEKIDLFDAFSGVSGYLSHVEENLREKGFKP
jgi:hypothetical protein